MGIQEAHSAGRVDAIAERLYESERARRAGPPPSTEWPDLTLSEAYSIQRAYLGLRQAHGATLVGHKVGCTNRVLQELFGIDRPDYGQLLDDMLLPDGAVINVATLIQPRIEPELAFVLREPLDGPGVTAARVLEATAGVVPCFEVVDSRIEDWRIAFVDTIADNGSSALFVMGDAFVDPRSIDLRTIGCVLEENGQVVATGAGAAVLGHPALSVAWLANELSRHGERLEAGNVVLSGALTTAPLARAGAVFHAYFGGVGAVRCQFVENKENE